MLDLEDLKRFAKLPKGFTEPVMRCIETTLEDYDACKAYIVRRLELRGEDAFKDVDVYIDVADDIKYEKLPNENKLLSVVEQMCAENCGKDFEKYRKYNRLRRND